MSGARFEVIVGRPWDRSGPAAEAAMRTRLHEQALRWLMRAADAGAAEANATADRIVDDQLGSPGAQTIALTADQLRSYLRLTREAAK